jgi:hypothetical protein
VRLRHPLLLTAATKLAGFAVLHRLGRTWGSTAAERRLPMPGDGIVTRPFGATTHAVTIDAPPEEVWPWIVQMGYHRAGWYTPRWVDRYVVHVDNPSADRILPEFQDLEVGDVVPDGEPGTAYFVVRELQPGRALVLHSDSHVPPRLTGRMRVAWTWSLLLEALDGEGGTRLILRARGSGSALARVMWHLAVVPGDFLMARSMLLGIKTRAERVREQPTRRDGGAGSAAG